MKILKTEDLKLLVELYGIRHPIWYASLLDTLVEDYGDEYGMKNFECEVIKENEKMKHIRENYDAILEAERSNIR